MNTYRIKGFTLVELLIVVMILAILAAIAVPQFAASTDDAKSSSVDTNLANLRAAIGLYYQQHGEYPGANTAVPGVGLCASGTKGVGTSAQAATVLEQLSLYTDADGGACSKSDATTKYGPYLKKATLPTESFSTPPSSALEVIGNGDLAMTATGGDPGGYKYDHKTGKLIINITAEQAR